MMKKYFLLLLLMFVLTSCGPVLQKKYTFIPPKDRFGIQCANHCIMVRERCLQRCMDRGSAVDLANKVISGSGNEGGNEAKAACSNSCLEAHRICHVNCGGQVKEEDICVALCD